MKNLFVALLVLISVSANAQQGYAAQTNVLTDTEVVKYFPLAVGNVYKFFYGFSNPVGNYFFKVRIIKDTVINSKRYFITSQALPGYGYSGGLFRIDSTSGNIYQRVSSGYCTYSPYELFRDSLRSRLGDSTFVCPQNTVKRVCFDTNYVVLFNNAVKVKKFSCTSSGITTTVTYGMNFGITNYSYYSSEGMSAQTLVGCYINGVLYGDTTLTNIENISSEIPSSYSLYQNYPNPFNPNTNIKFSIISPGNVRLVVYDITGREVQTPVNERLNPGTYEVSFDGSALNSGVYFYKITTGDFSQIRKMVLIK